MSVTVGLFEYLIEEKGEEARMRLHDEGKTETEEKKRGTPWRRVILFVKILRQREGKRGGGEKAGEGKRIQHTVVSLSRPFSPFLSRWPLSLSLSLREREGPGGENPGTALRV